MVYFEKVVVANVLCIMLVTLDVTHVERSPLNTVAPENTDPRSMGTTDNSTIGGVFKQESYKIEKRKKKRENKLQNRQKEAFNLVRVCVKTGRNSQTKGKKNNFCIVYFEEVVVAHVLAKKVFTLETSQSPITPFPFSPAKVSQLPSAD